MDHIHRDHGGINELEHHSEGVLAGLSDESLGLAAGLGYISNSYVFVRAGDCCD